MRASRGEIKIEEILTAAELPFKMEYSFPNLTSSNGRPLRFDFAVFENNNLSYLLEFVLEFKDKKFQLLHIITIILFIIPTIFGMYKYIISQFASIEPKFEISKTVAIFCIISSSLGPFFS